MDSPGTPHNSIYQFLPNSTRASKHLPDAPQCDGELVCCTHGAHCDFIKVEATKAADDENNAYVNLVDVDEKERLDLISHMKKELEFSDFFNRKKKKKKAKDPPTDEELFPRKDKPKSVKKADSSDELNAKDSLEVAARIAAMSALEPAKVPPPLAPPASSPFKAAYIGMCSYSEAELAVKKKAGKFRIYHRMPSALGTSDLAEECRLFMIYRLCAEGPPAQQFRHFPVRGCGGSEGSARVYVDYGDPRAGDYKDLDELVTAFKKEIRLGELVPCVAATPRR